MTSLPEITRSIAGLIDIIYDQDDREALFKSFCAHLEQTVPLGSALFTNFEPKSGRFLFLDHLRFGMEEIDALLYCACSAPTHPVVRSKMYHGLIARKKNMPVRITDILAASRLSSTESSRDFLSRSGAFYELFAMLGFRKSLVGCLMIQRAKTAGDFTDREAEIVGLLLPHLSRVLHDLNVCRQADLELTAFGIPPAIVSHLSGPLMKLGLTPRQVEIAALAVLGNTNLDIARKLSISEQTVKDHLERIFRRMGVKHRSELSARVLMEKAA